MNLAGAFAGFGPGVESGYTAMQNMAMKRLQMMMALRQYQAQMEAARAFGGGLSALAGPTPPQAPMPGTSSVPAASSYREEAPLTVRPLAGANAYGGAPTKTVPGRYAGSPMLPLSPAAPQQPAPLPPPATPGRAQAPGLSGALSLLSSGSPEQRLMRVFDAVKSANPKASPMAQEIATKEIWSMLQSGNALNQRTALTLLGDALRASEGQATRKQRGEHYSVMEAQGAGRVQAEQSRAASLQAGEARRAAAGLQKAKMTALQSERTSLLQQLRVLFPQVTDPEDVMASPRAKPILERIKQINAEIAKIAGLPIPETAPAAGVAAAPAAPAAPSGQAAGGWLEWLRRLSGQQNP